MSPALLGERDSSGLGGTKVQGPQAGEWEERRKLRLKRVLGGGLLASPDLAQLISFPALYDFSGTRSLKGLFATTRFSIRRQTYCSLKA